MKKYIKTKSKWEMHPANTNQKKVRIATLISDRADFKQKRVTGDKEEYYI